MRNTTTDARTLSLRIHRHPPTPTIVHSREHETSSNTRRILEEIPFRIHEEHQLIRKQWDARMVHTCKNQTNKQINTQTKTHVGLFVDSTSGPLPDPNFESEGAESRFLRSHDVDKL